jgi:hypothetical protein
MAHTGTTLHLFFTFTYEILNTMVMTNTGKRLLHNHSGVSTTYHLQHLPLLLYQEAIAVES